MYCRYCGNPIDRTTMTCVSCGRQAGPLADGNSFRDLFRQMKDGGELPAQAPTAQTPAAQTPAASAPAQQPVSVQAPAKVEGPSRLARPNGRRESDGGNASSLFKVSRHIPLIGGLLCLIIALCLLFSNAGYKSKLDQMNWQLENQSKKIDDLNKQLADAVTTPAPAETAAPAESSAPAETEEPEETPEPSEEPARFFSKPPLDQGAERDETLTAFTVLVPKEYLADRDYEFVWLFFREDEAADDNTDDTKTDPDEIPLPTLPAAHGFFGGGGTDTDTDGDLPDRALVIKVVPDNDPMYRVNSPEDTVFDPVVRGDGYRSALTVKNASEEHEGYYVCVCIIYSYDQDSGEKIIEGIHFSEPARFYLN